MNEEAPGRSSDESSRPPTGRDEAVGSLGEEAAKLLGALSQWAETQDAAAPRPATGGSAEAGGPDVEPEPGEPDRSGPGPAQPPPGSSTGPGPAAGSTEALLDAAAHAVRGLAESLRRVDEHLATGGSDCRYCPLCQVIHAVRGTGPEVRAHLGDAAGSLLAAVAGLVPERGAPGPAPAPDTATRGVQKIDLTDNGWETPGPAGPPATS